MSENLLGQETSPYLLQHADNPVHWKPWGPEALAEAKENDKPILLSVGYAACHWCHVMAHESFENDDIAALMNEHYVCIKVDREERPDIDTIYQTALSLLGQQGGWPLTMFLTPDGEPFWGGTYFPPDARYGRPGFGEVLQRLSHAFHNDKDTVNQNRAAILQHLSVPERATANDDYLAPDSLYQTASRLVEHIDMDNGGLGGSPKFPNIPVFELLWRASLVSADDPADQPFAEATELTLERMCEGGIYDHLGGGFARYSVDARWFAPHFEKMLYDNAQILDLMTMVWQSRRTPLLRRRTMETVDWLLAEMIAGNGAFAATLDADSEGKEGKFYIWSTDEIADWLGTEADYFCQTYGAREQGNWDEGGAGANILNRLHLPYPPDEMDEERLEPMRRVLRRVRDGRVRPGWDDKVLADWNGMMIASLAHASAVFDQPAWLEAAINAFNAVVSDLAYTDDTGHARLHHSWRLDSARHEGLLDDYANMARAALVLFEHTDNPTFLDHAQAWIATVDARFWDDTLGGYFFTADDAEALIVRTKSVHDNAVPAGNALMVDVLNRSYLLSGNLAHRDRAHNLISAFASDVVSNPVGAATFVNNFDTLINGRQIIIIGNREEAGTKALLDVVYGTSVPGRLLQVIAPATELGDHHPAKGKDQVDGKPTAYICRGETCSLPLTEAAALADALSTP